MNTLQDLLVDGTRYDPHYLPSMNSNHMPMTLCAISGLGGHFDNLLEFQEEYKKKLHETTPEDPSPSWRLGIGRSESYPSLFAWFRDQVVEKGIKSTVSEFLPEFIGSLALQAFHPIIRLAYAVDFESESETAAALAYMVSNHQNVPVNTDRVIDIRNEMRGQVKAGSRSFKGTGFTQSIRELLEVEQYPVGLTTDISDCAVIALDVYRSTRDFFALHMVTATQATRICSELIGKRPALAALTGSLLAAHQVVGSPHFDRDNPMPVPNQLDQEHAYKYAWTCLSEYRHYGDERYLEEIREFRKNALIPRWCADNEV